MWNKILSFYHKRIQTYATHLHTLLESFPRVNEDEDEDLKCLMELRTHCRVANNQERRDSIVKIATKLRNSEQLRTLLHGSFFSDGIKIWKAICFLARTNSFFTTFIEFRQKFGRFRQVRVVGLKDMQAKKKAEPASSFDNALKSFGLQPNSSVAKKYFGTPNLKELRKRFNVIQLQPLYSHVEIQLICYLMRERLSERTIPYIGCSKRSCLICWNFLKHLPGAFRTRGCHGKLYNRWTVPKISNPNTADQISINTALGSVQRELQKIVLLPASPIDPVPNPAIVMSASNEANSAASNELPPLLKLLMEKIPERERQAKIHKLL